MIGTRGARRVAVRASGAVASVVTVVLIAFGGLLLVAGRLPVGAERRLVVPALATAAVAVALHGPVRRRVGRSLRPRPVGRTPEQVLTAASADGAGLRTAELLLELAGAVRTTLRVDVAEVWSATGTLLDRQVASPSRTSASVGLSATEVDALIDAAVVGDAWARLWAPDLLEDATSRVRIASVAHAGVLLAALVVRRRNGAPFQPGEERRLADIADRLGVLLHNRRLDEALAATVDDLRRTNLELAASRTRVVAAADAERRRIERDLHDGAQQHLVALALHLRLARELVTTDPEAAAAALDDLGNMVGEVGRGVRDLARGIYPSALEEGGIAEALRGVTDRATTPVRLRDGQGLRRYRPELEAAVYFVVLEALQNATKHAPGAPVTIDLDESDGAIVFSVADDGPGFDPAAVADGHGRQHARDRLGAFGGDIRWESRPGHGCTVHGRIPAVPRGAPA